LADLSEEEFRAGYLGLDRSRDDPDIHWPPADIPDVEVLREFDWRAKGAVTPVKNQVPYVGKWAWIRNSMYRYLYSIRTR
jgi:hypothetical protein